MAYAQLVFTIPKMLRPAFLWDRKLYGDLCPSAYAATRTFFEAQFPSLEKPVPAMLAAPQSFGNLLNHHPHSHALTSLGVFTRDGVFHPVPEDIDFDPVEIPQADTPETSQLFEVLEENLRDELLPQIPDSFLQHRVRTLLRLVAKIRNNAEIGAELDALELELPIRSMKIDVLSEARPQLCRVFAVHTKALSDDKFSDLVLCY